MSARRAGPVVWLVLILLLCAGLKVRHNDRPFVTDVDGGLYTDIAEHVRDGDGLVTDVSPYHHGYPRFPHPTAIYPAWPLLYGHLARCVPLRLAGVWAPTLGYFAALIFAYLWAAALVRPSPLRPARGEAGPALPAGIKPGQGPSRRRGGLIGAAGAALAALGPGHALVLFLGLNGKFFAYTSLPYTEGLGYALLFACLWRFGRIGGSLSLGRAVEMGIWLAALMLVRSHFFIVALAAVLALGWTAYGSRARRGWLRPALAAAVFAALLVPWYVHISGFVPKGRIAAMLRYDQARANDLLSPFHAVVPASGLGAFVGDRLNGLKVAFSPSSESGYAANFRGLPYAFLLALAWAGGALGLGSRARPLKAVWPALRAVRFDTAFLFLFSAGAWASLQLMHMDVAQPWLFGHRHALLMIVPFFLAWRWLLGSKRLLGTIAAAAIGIYTIGGSYADCRAASAEDALGAGRGRPVARWLAAQPPGQGPRVVAAPGVLPQLLAPQAPGVGFHAVYGTTTAADLRVLFERLGAGLLVLEDRGSGRSPAPPGVDADWFRAYFEPAAVLPGYVLFTKRGPDP